MAGEDLGKGKAELLAARSRRGLLAGAAGALGLLAGETVLGGTSALAGTDGDVVLGAENTAYSVTAIDTSGVSGADASTALVRL